MQSEFGQSSAHLEGSWRDEGDVVVVQREGLERGQGAEGPLRQELQPVLLQVDGRRLTGELFGQLGHAGAIAQHAAALLLRAGAGRRAGPDAGPAPQHCLGQQAQQRHWREGPSGTEEGKTEAQ